MQNKRCAINSESGREDCGADGAVTVSRSRTICRVLLPWAVAAAMLLGGGLAAQAQSITPADKCAVSGTTVTCTGNLSPRVDVDGRSGTYTKLIVIDLTDDIVLKEGLSIRAVEFISEGDIDITIDTGDFRIASTDGCRDCGGIAANSYSDGVVTVRVTGVITTSGQYSEGISAVSDGGNEDDGGVVTVEMTGKIVTEGGDIQGIYALSATDRVKVTMDGNITVSGGNSTGIHAQADSSMDASDTVTVDVTGDITVKDIGGKGIFARADTGNIGITLHGGTINAGANGVEFVGGPTGTGVFNTLTINNAVTISGATYDVLGGTGDEKIDNYGTLTTPGRIDLGTGANSFNNMAGATFNPGTAVFLGSNNRFTNEGDLSPGGASAVQETTLTGVLVSEQGSTFTVTIDNTGSDLLIVTDSASLDGTVRVVGAYEGTYKILDAARLSLTENEFNEVIDTLFMDFELNYLDDDDVGNDVDYVELIAARKQGVTFGEFAETANQRAVANALDSLPAANATALDVMAASSEEDIRAAYDARSGEVHASLKGALMGTGQRQVAAVKSRMAARFGNPGAQASTAASGTPPSPADGSSGLWVTGYRSRSETDATAGTARMDTDLDGVVFGIEGALGERWRLGVLGGYSRTDVSQRALLSSGSVDTWSAGLYGAAESGAARLSFGAVYNGHAVDSRRSVLSIGLSEIQNLSARYDARSWQVFAEAGYRVRSRDRMVEPFAGVSSIHLDTDGFSESGGDAALTSSSDIDHMMFATLGLRSAVQMDDTVRIRSMVGWRHAFGDTDPSSTHSMAGSPFTVTGAPTAEDALDIELGIETELSDTAVLGVAYKGRYGGGAADHGFNAGLRVTF